jgi:hypothetical protein
MSDQVETAQAVRGSWIQLAVGLTAVLSVLAIVLSAFALSESGKQTVITAPAMSSMMGAPRAASSAASASPGVKLVMAFKSDTEHGKLGPDGQWHDAALPASFSVPAGAHVTLTLRNYDGSGHSFTSPTLGTGTTVPGGSATSPGTTVVTFTAPTSPGRYLWFCDEPCDPWAMAHVGFMRGYVTVTS